MQHRSHSERDVDPEYFEQLKKQEKSDALSLWIAMIGGIAICGIPIFLSL
jgi:hypothetical protein